jgi:hypothetical protein
MNFRKKLGSLLTFNKKPVLPDLTKIQGELGNKFFGILNNTFDDRLKNVTNSALSQTDVDELIKSYSQKNMLIAAASSIVPGPLGVFSAIPELVLTLGNQMAMIYDTGCAFDKENFLNKDVLVDIPIAAFGGDTDLAALQSSAVDLMDSPVEVLTDKAFALGESMLERTLKKSVIKFVPVGGSMIMALFAQRSTKKIAKTSKSFFDNAKVLVSKDLTISKETANLLELEKIKACIDLIDSDNDIDDGEIQFIQPMIEGSDLPVDKKKQLLKEAQSLDSQLIINYNVFRAHPEETDDFVADLIILGNRDGAMKEAEKNYILEFCEKADFEKEEALEMMQEIEES